MIVIQGEEIMRPSTSPSMGAIFTFVVRNKDKIFDAVISSPENYLIADFCFFVRVSDTEYSFNLSTRYSRDPRRTPSSIE